MRSALSLPALIGGVCPASCQRQADGPAACRFRCVHPVRVQACASAAPPALPASSAVFMMGLPSAYALQAVTRHGWAKKQKNPIDAGVLQIGAVIGKRPTGEWARRQ